MKKRPAAIITTDRHYRDDKPRCRKDNFKEAMQNKHLFIEGLQEKYDVPCLDAGDFFDDWTVSAFLEGWLISNITRDLITVPGNHEIPDHNTNRLDRSSLNVLIQSGTIDTVMSGYTDPIMIKSKSSKYDCHLVYGFPFGSAFDKKAELRIPDIAKGSRYLKIAIAHIFAYTEYRDFMGKDAVNVTAINRLAPQFDLIITGHNHLCFSSKTKKNLVINPGSMMRTRSTQTEYKPAVFLWYDEDNTVEPVYLPIEEDVFHKEMVKVNSFSEKLKNEENIIDEDVELLYKKNLELYYKKNETRKSVIDFINRSMG